MLGISRDECIQLNQIVLQSNLTRENRILRSTFLHMLPRLIEFDAASFFLAGQGAGKMEEEPVSLNLAESYMRTYAEAMVDKDEIIPHIFCKAPFFYRVTDLISLDSSDVYNSFLKPQGLRYAQGMNLVWGERFLGAVVLFRDKGNSNFSDKDLFLLSQFQSHLSLGLYQTIYREQQKSIQKIHIMAHYQLTAREMEVIEYLLRGSTNQEISEVMFIHIDTVKTHLKNIYRKLDVSHRAQVQTIFMALEEKGMK